MRLPYTILRRGSRAARMPNPGPVVVYNHSDASRCTSAADDSPDLELLGLEDGGCLYSPSTIGRYRSNIAGLGGLAVGPASCARAVYRHEACSSPRYQRQRRARR